MHTTKLPTDPRLPTSQTANEPSWRQRLIQRLEELFRDFAKHVNQPVPAIRVRFTHAQLVPVSGLHTFLLSIIDVDVYKNVDLATSSITRLPPGIYEVKASVLFENPGALNGFLYILKNGGRFNAAVMTATGFGVNGYSYGAVSSIVQIDSETDAISAAIVRDGIGSPAAVYSQDAAWSQLTVTRIGHSTN
jgi:hypothetical protein